MALVFWWPADRSAARRGGSAATTRKAGARSGNQRRRALAIWGSVGVLGLTAGASVAMNLTEGEGEPVAVVRTPPPAQLPVPAPAGWDTYGAWATPMSGSQVQAVLDWEGQVAAAMSVAGPATRMDDGALDRLGPLVRDAARAASRLSRRPVRRPRRC